MNQIQGKEFSDVDRHLVSAEKRIARSVAVQQRNSDTASIFYQRKRLLSWIINMLLTACDVLEHRNASNQSARFAVIFCNVEPDF